MGNRYWFRRRGVFVTAITRVQGYIAYLALVSGILILMPEWVRNRNAMVKTAWFLLWLIGFHVVVLSLGVAKGVGVQSASSTRDQE